MMYLSKNQLIAGAGSIIVLGLVMFGLNTSRNLLTLKAPNLSQGAGQSTATNPVAISPGGQVLGDSVGAAAVAETSSGVSGYVNPFRVAAGAALTTASLPSVDNGAEDLLAPAVSATAQIHPSLYIRGFVYPISELGNCSSAAGCFQYCQASSNLTACANFSQRHGFMAKQAAVPQVLAAIDGGIGNSGNEGSIDRATLQYLDECNSMATPTAACLDWEENLGYITPEARRLIESGQGSSAAVTGGGAGSGAILPNLDTIQQQQQTAGNNYTACVNNANSAAVGGTTNTAALQQCQAQYQQELDSVNQPTLQQSRQGAMDDVGNVAQCLSSLNDIRSGLNQCLQRLAQ